MMYIIHIVKTKEHTDSVYCGRGSVLGNPFPITQHASRNYVCDEYQIYFDEQIQINKIFMMELVRIHTLGKRYGEVKLGCFCAPERCHTETIKKFLENNQELLDSY